MNAWTKWMVVGLVMVGLVGCGEEAQTRSGGGDETANTGGDGNGGSGNADTGHQPEFGDPVLSSDYEAKANAMVDKAIRYLLDNQAADGSWSIGGANKPAMTAMVAKALLQQPSHDANSEPVKRALALVLSYQQDDGGIYDPQTGRQNYTTAIAVMALAEANKPEYKPALNKAVNYLRGIQIVPGSKTPDGVTISEDHPFFGGVSYGKHGRPDMSNLSMWVDAMHEAGVPGDDPAMQRALVFVQRTQNRSESNPLAFAQKGNNDGGFVYAPARADGSPESKAGEDPDGALRSYGSMTYAGFKSMLYAGLKKNDPRVRAAYDWIRQYWRLDANPNMPHTRNQQGLYYYYHVFAKALRAWSEPVITDSKGVKHNWRHELVDALAKRVSEDGSWTNQAEERWYEGNPTLATAYSVLALQEALNR